MALASLLSTTTMASLLELARRRKASRPIAATPLNPGPSFTPSDRSSSPPNHQSDFDATAFTRSDPAATPNPFAPSATPQALRLKSFGERALKRVKLSDDSQAEFKQYIEVPPVPSPP